MIYCNLNKKYLNFKKKQKFAFIIKIILNVLKIGNQNNSIVL